MTGEEALGIDSTADQGHNSFRAGRQPPLLEVLPGDNVKA